jgi:ABC-type uncharacterized transport system substrate-binding protein
MWPVAQRLFLGIFLIALTSGILLFSDLEHRRSGPGRVPRVALVQLTSSSLLDSTMDGIAAALSDSGFVDRKTMQSRRYNAQGDMSVLNSIARDVTTSGYDLVVTVSTPAMQAVASANRAGSTLHVFGAVADPAASGVGISRADPMDHPKQLTGVGTLLPAGDSFRLARECFPGLRTVGVVWNPGEDNSRIFTTAARAACRELGIQLLEANADNTSDVQNAASSLTSRGAQAIWVGGDNVAISAIDSIIATAQKARIPVFTIVPGKPDRGTLFDLGADFFNVGEVTGLLAAQVLRGTPPAMLPVKNYWPKQLIVNAQALRGLKDPWRLPDAVAQRATILVDAAGVHTRKREGKPTLAGTLGISVPLTRRWATQMIQYVNVVDVEDSERGLRDGLKESGLVEGRDFTVKVRNAQGDMATLNSLVDAALTERADLIMTLSTPTLQAALQRVRTQPVIFCYLADPMAAGAGKSDEEHRANVTGAYTRATPEESIAVLKQVVPSARVIGTLFAPTEVNSVFMKDQLVAAAHRNGMEVVPVGVSTATEVADAAMALCGRRIDAVCQIPGNLTTVSFTTIAQAARKARVPIIGMQSAQIAQGAPIAVSRDYYEAGRQAGILAARVMRGENPASIPFEQVKRTRILVNLKAAHESGLRIPPALLARAEKVGQ